MIQVFVDTDQFGRQDITERVGRFSFLSRCGVGFDAAQVEIDAPERDLWPLVDAEAESLLEFHWNGSLLWKGKFCGPQLSGAHMTIYAEGAGARLQDGELWRIFSDAEYGRWTPPATLPDGFSADNNNRLLIGCDGVMDAGDEAYLIYPSAGVELGADIVHFSAAVAARITLGRWLIGLRDESGAIVWSAAVQGTLYAEGVDYELDLTNSRLRALAGGAIDDGQELAVSYQHSNVIEDEEIFANLDVWVALQNAPREETLVVRGEETYVEGGGDDYTVDYAAGKFYANAAGDIEDGQSVLVGYTYVEHVIDEQILANLDIWVPLAYNDIRAGTVAVVNAYTGAPYAEGPDYEIDYVNGALKALSTGTIDDGRRLHVDYDYNAVVADEEVQANTGARALLAHKSINSGSFSAKGVGAAYAPGTDYVADYTNGRLMADSGGAIPDGQRLYCSYHHVETVVDAVQANLGVWMQLSGTYIIAGTAVVADAAEAIHNYDLALTVSGAAGLELFMRSLQDGAGDASLEATGVVVRTLHPTYSDQVAEAILNGEGIAAHDVRANSLEVDLAAWQGETPAEALEQMAQLGSGAVAWLFVVYENGAEFRPWATEPDWRLERADLDEWTVEWRREDVRNAVRAETPDGYRTAWVTDDDSIAQWGRREETIRVPQTLPAEAARLATVYLADHAWPVAGLELDLGARCRRPDGSLFPAFLMRAGDVVVLHDLIPDRQETIRLDEVEVTPDSVRITPAGAASRLETVIAKIEKAHKQELQRVAAAAATVAGRGGGAMFSQAGSDHEAVTLAAGSDPALMLVGQELALAPVVSAADLVAHAGDADAHHAPTTAGAGNWNAALSLSGQEWTLSQATLDARYSQVGHTHAHADLTGVDANQHVDHTGVSLAAGAGLTGGGTIAASRTFAVGAGDGITVNADDVALTTPGTLTVTTANSAAGSHTHAITSVNVATAAANLLSCDASGYLQLVRLGVGTAPAVPLHAVAAGEQLRLGADAVNYIAFRANSSGYLNINATGGFCFFGYDTAVVSNAARFYNTDNTKYLQVGFLGNPRLDSYGTSLQINQLGNNNAAFFEAITEVKPTLPTGHPNLYVFGYDTGASGAKFGRLGVDADGDFNIEAETGESLSLITTGQDRLSIDASGHIGIGTGTTAISAWLHVLGTTEQLRLANTAAAYTSFTTDATGDLTIAPTGGDVGITGNLDVSRHVAIGANASVQTARILEISEQTIDTTVSYYALNVDLVKTAGATDFADDMYGVRYSFHLNQAGGEIGMLYGVAGLAKITDGSVGAAGNARSAYGAYCRTQQVGGTITGNAVGGLGFADLDAGTAANAMGGYSQIDQEAAHTLSGNAYGAYISVDLDGTVTGTAYMLYLNELSGLDYCIYQNGTAPSLLGGKLHFRDTAIGVYSQADTFLDLFADGAVRIGDSAAGAPTNYVNISPTGDLSFVGSAGFYPVLLAQDAEPVPGMGEFLIWKDANDSNRIYAMLNDADAGVVKVEMT